MSSFLTSDETRAIVACFLIDNKQFIKALMKNENLFYQNYNVEYLYSTLSALNVHALAERYGFEFAYENSDCITRKIDFNKFHDVNVETFIIKTMCFVYQCQEGVIENHKILDFLDRLVDKIINVMFDGNIDNVMSRKEVSKLWN